MAGLGLALGRGRQQKLVALRGDVVDLDIDLLIGGPLLDDRLRRLIGAGHPMIPETDRQLAGGVRAADIGCCQECGRGCGRGEKATPRELAAHERFPFGSRGDAALLCVVTDRPSMPSRIERPS